MKIRSQLKSFFNAEDFDASLWRTVSVSNHIFNVLLVVWERGIASLSVWYFMMDFRGNISYMPSCNTILHISVFLCRHRVRCQIFIYFVLFSNTLRISELNLVGHSNTSRLSLKRNKSEKIFYRLQTTIRWRQWLPSQGLIIRTEVPGGLWLATIDL